MAPTVTRDTEALLWSSGTPLFLAPQAGVSESPFRRLCRDFGADVVVTEFVSADGVVKGTVRTRNYLRFDPEEHPIGVQIFGSDPAMMAEAAAQVAELFAPDFVDINFGCPVKKVVRRNGGSGCLRDLDLVQSIIRTVGDAIALPVSVKIRSGYDEVTRDPVAIGRHCQDAGAHWITLHPRTRADMYGGVARWEEIRALVEALSIPVIGNGDIRTGDDARRMKDETGCHGIMIARGSHGDPWIFRQARAALDGLPVPPDPGRGGTLPDLFAARVERDRLRARRRAGYRGVPQAPGLVHEGAARGIPAAAGAVRSQNVGRDRGEARGVPGRAAAGGRGLSAFQKVASVGPWMFRRG